VYHPEGNGPVESWHRTLTVGLSHFAPASLSDPARFDEALALVLYVYRSTFHSAIDDSPAFMTFGTDPRPPLENDWRAFRPSTSHQKPDPHEQDRLRFLNLLRLEVQARANARALLLAEKSNEARLDRRFQLNDLVLLRLRPADLVRGTSEEVREKSKLHPKWSLPYRVTAVYSQGKAATVRSCISSASFPIREVHLQDARFINRPLTDAQRSSWALELSRELTTSILDPDQRHDLVARFFEDVELGDVTEEANPPDLRRPRAALPGAAG